MKLSDTVPFREVTDVKTLRRAFGTFATGVTVVTTGGTNPHAMTANSFTSVSLDPPLVLICVDRGAVMHQCLSEAGAFGVSVLAAHQEPVAMHFANRWRTLGAAQFDAVDWLPGEATGVPLLSGTLASFECELWRTYDGGDHTIFIGKVLSLHQQTDQEALLVVKGRFRQVGPDWSEVIT
ncbi:flavin reductase family protein [Sphaerisporangium rubeum]|uniref:Flavin reductase (DIM6/NTAB) family NADH-FMN oxidoreductase RutF n=1 Tax=Sphaerisporangium rubeum TaxID=321317 RepID=A0A7X0IDQ1_9ACTN|nr:flavin reductase (DIM6/NTAB) family NADH-FMN oxidoreductase RutF [Sphaerisporangium rubeum]